VEKIDLLQNRGSQPGSKISGDNWTKKRRNGMLNQWWVRRAGFFTSLFFSHR